MRPTSTATAAAFAAALFAGGVRLAGEERANGGQPMRVEAVPSVDLARYAGVWYEIARFPNRFQTKCACCVSATYTLLPDARVSVVNQCRTSDGAFTRAEGVARRADSSGPDSRLKVRFAPGFLSFLPFVWGDYWILDLADDYSHALVGSPDRGYLWVLAREATLPDATYARIVDAARRQGFDVARLVRTPQQLPAAARP
jgi:apolipoprotein D and lipocalin family protein